jgi:hypothetical protein
MRTLWFIGAFVAATGALGAQLSIPSDFGAWSDPGREVPVAGMTEAVRHQLDARAGQLATLHAQNADSTARVLALREHLASASSPLLLDARRALAEEAVVADTIKNGIRRLLVDRKTAKRDAGGMALLTVVTLLVTGLIGGAISRSKALVPAPPSSGLRGAAVGIAVGTVLFASNTLQDLLTSVCVDAKESFGFASWAVSRWSWTWVRVMALGLCLAFANVLAFAWSAAAPERRPEPDAGHEDGGFGVVRYVTAWRWWVLLGASASLAIAVAEVLAIAYGQGRFNPWYLLTPVVCLVATAAPVARAALRIQELRDACRRIRWIGSRRSPDVPIPEDPTDAFWEVPLKVPTYVVVAAGAAWIALEKTGVAGAILRSVNARGP